MHARCGAVSLARRFSQCRDGPVERVGQQPHVRVAGRERLGTVRLDLLRQLQGPGDERPDRVPPCVLGIGELESGRCVIGGLGLGRFGIRAGVFQDRSRRRLRDARSIGRWVVRPGTVRSDAIRVLQYGGIAVDQVEGRPIDVTPAEVRPVQTGQQHFSDSAVRQRGVGIGVQDAGEEPPQDMRGYVTGEGSGERLG